MWKILGIEKTKDEDKIKAAYRKQLVKVNPEEDPAGFKELREAYEEAVKWAKKAKKKKDPLQQWLYDIGEIYDNFYRRIDEEEWEEIFENEVCSDLDTADDARMEMIKFLMGHYFLPQFVWQRVWDVFEFEEEREMLAEKVSNDFITYIEYRAENEDYFDYELYEGPIEADYDIYIKDINLLKTYVDDGNLEKAEKYVEKVEKSQITHPYAKMEVLRYYLAKGDDRWKQMFHELEEELYDNPFLAQLKGELFVREGRYQEAKEIFTKVLTEVEGHQGAIRNLVKIHQKLGEYEEAKKLCLEVLEDKIPDEKICIAMIEINQALIEQWKDREDKKIDLAWCYYQNQKFPECLRVLRTMKPEGEVYFDYYNLIARVLLETGDYQEGYEMTKIWIANIEHLTGEEKDYERKSKRYGYAHFIASMYCLEMNMEEKCQEYLERALELDTEQIDVMMYRERRMESFLKRKEYQRCIKEANRTLEVSEFFYPAYIYRQECNYYLFRAQQVMDDFYRAIELAPEQGKPYVMVMRMLFNLNMMSEIRNIIEMGRRNQVEDQEFHFYCLEYERLLAQDAQDLLRIADEMKPLISKHLDEKDGRICYRIGLIYDRLQAEAAQEDQVQKYTKEAFYYAKKAVEADKTVPQYEWLLGDIYQRLQKHKEAIVHYERVLELDGSLFDAWIDMGNSYEALGKDPDAIRAMEKGAKGHPNHEYVHNSLMNLYLRRFAKERERADFEAASVHADRQLQIVSNAYYYRERAYLYIEDMQLEKAFSDIKKSYELEPEDLYAISSMGYIHRLMGDYQSAIAYYEKAEKQAETPAQQFSLYRWWGPIYERAGMFEEALSCYWKCLAIDETSGEVLEEIAWIHMRMYQYEKAAHYYEEAMKAEEERSEQLLTEAAKAYYYNGNPLKALKFLKQAQLNYPNSGDVLCQLGEFYLEEKADLKKAYKFYYQACGLREEEPYIRLVEVFAKMGKTEDARKMCRLAEKKIDRYYGSMEDFLRKKEYQKYVYYNIAMMYYYSGEVETVKKYLLQIKKRPMCYFCSYGFCYEEAFLEAALLALEGKKEAAQDLCRKILEQDRNLGEVRQFLNKLEERN
jgi:tetratricopeptide (TPR) repeat protein